MKRRSRSTGWSDLIDRFKEFGDRSSLSHGRRKLYRCLLVELFLLKFNTLSLFCSKS